LKHLTLSNGQQVTSRAVILAGGAEFKKIPFPGSDGPGVYLPDGLNALVEEGADGYVTVIGGSNGAAQAALKCAETAEHVYILARSSITKSMSEYQVSAVRNHSKITVIEGDEIATLHRDEQGNPRSMETKKGQVLQVNALGLFTGQKPAAGWAPDEIKSKSGAIKADVATLETQIPGVYAVGDMRDGGPQRILASAGEGQQALRMLYNFLDEQKKQYLQGAKATAKQASKPDRDAAKPALLPIQEIYDLDLAEPWFGQTVEGEGVTPPKKKQPSSENESKEWPLVRARAYELLERTRPFG
jgi:thioredoxin reductase (NADPH)